MCKLSIFKIFKFFFLNFKNLPTTTLALSLILDAFDFFIPTRTYSCTISPQRFNMGRTHLCCSSLVPPIPPGHNACAARTRPVKNYFER